MTRARDKANSTVTNFASTGIDDNASSTAVTIDSSSNLLVGKTAANVAAEGAEIRSSGFTGLTVDGGAGLTIRRLTSDGELQSFFKDTTKIGSIGSYAGLYTNIGTSDVGLMFNTGAQAVIPHNMSTNATRDNAIDLGQNGIRWKDLYLSGVSRLGTSTTYATIEGKANSDLEITANAGQVNGTPNIIFKSSNAGSAVAERMRITSAGAVLANTTSNLGGVKFSVAADTTSDNPMSVVNTRTTASTDYSILFYRAGSIVGSVQTSLSATSFVTSSDYRLKTAVNYDWDATTRLKQLKPARFSFIADPNTVVDGFLAHEVQDVVPEAISGNYNEVEVWKDGEELPDGVSVGDNKLDDDGNTIPVMQGIDQAKLVPLLCKTILELEARITALESS